MMLTPMHNAPPFPAFPLLPPVRFDKAASWCARLLRGDPSGWEAAVARFAAAGQLAVLAPYIPTGGGGGGGGGALVLREGVYTSALTSLVNARGQHARLLATIRSWPTKLYRAAVVIAELNARIPKVAMSDPEEAIGLKEVLAELLLAAGHREAALALNVELGKPGVLDLLADSRGQLAGVRDKVAQLAALDHEGVVPLLVEERLAVPPEAVVLQLRSAVRPRPPDALTSLPISEHSTQLHPAPPSSARQLCAFQHRPAQRPAPSSAYSARCLSVPVPFLILRARTPPPPPRAASAEPPQRAASACCARTCENS